MSESEGQQSQKQEPKTQTGSGVPQIELPFGLGRFTFGIQIKIGALIGIFSIVIVLVISTILINQTRQKLELRLDEQARLICRTIARTASEDLDIVGGSMLNTLVLVNDIVRSESGVSNAFIIDSFRNKGEIIVPLGAVFKDPIPYDDWKDYITLAAATNRLKVKFSSGRRLREYAFPIVTYIGGRDQVIALARVSFQQKVITREINKTILLGFIVSLLVIGGAITAAFFLSTYIVSPIKKLHAGAVEIGNGNLNYQIDVATKDELEALAVEFNTMTSRLLEAQKSMIEQERLTYELSIATNIQTSLLPKKFPDVSGVQYGSFYKSAKEIGGDYFDVIGIDATRVGIIMADVSGKGVPGAMVMVMTRSTIRTQAFQGASAFETLCRTNELLYPDIDPGMFVSCFYGILDTQTMILELANAGHDPLIIYSKRAGRCKAFPPKGIAIGAKKNKIFRPRLQGARLQLHEGDIIITYTDGILESMNKNREEYGEERFHAAINKFALLEPKKFVENIIADIDAFVGDAPQNDDIAFLVVKACKDGIPRTIKKTAAASQQPLTKQGPSTGTVS